MRKRAIRLRKFVTATAAISGAAYLCTKLTQQPEGSARAASRIARSLLRELPETPDGKTFLFVMFLFTVWLTVAIIWKGVPWLLGFFAGGKAWRDEET